MIYMEVELIVRLFSTNHVNKQNFIFLPAMRAATWETDAEKQKELFEKVNQDNIQPHIEKVEQHIIKNGSGHLVGQGVRSINYTFSNCYVLITQKCVITVDLG